jgi:pimeloyl-ACP methyl ester carboxylesterase
MMGVAGRRLRVGQWHAETSPAQRPLVIFSGIGMNMEMLEPIASRMPGRRILSFDMPGIGKSPDPIFPYTIPQIALTLAALLDRLQIDSVDLLGMSWGGAVAQQFAFQHRARTGKLVLAATSAGGTMIPGNPAMISQMLDPMEYSVEKTLRRNLATFYNGGGADRVSLNAATAPSPLGWTYQLAAFAGWSSAPFLPLLAMPVLILADEDDQLIPPANAHFLHNAIPASKLEMTAGGGHLFMLSRPDRFIAKLNGFLDEAVCAPAD